MAIQVALPHFSCRVVCSVLAERGGKILLLRRGPGSVIRQGGWDLPGGILEQDEDLSECVKREFCEETGLTLASAPRIIFAESGCGEGFWIRLVFIADSSEGEVRLSPEHCDHAWATPKEALALDYGKGGEFQRRAVEEAARPEME